MRRTVLLLCACLALSSYASDNPVYQTKETILKPQINKPAEPFRAQKERDLTSKFLKASPENNSVRQIAEKGNISLSENPAIKQLKAMAASAKTERLDSIIGSYSFNNEKFSKQEFLYDSNNLSLLRINSYWNSSSNTYDPAEEYGYEWDEEGYCLRMWGRTFDGYSGSQYEFKYNDRKLGIEQIISYYSDGEWIPSEKGEYTYDENGYIIDETISLYEPETKLWHNTLRNKASWTQQGWQTSYECYSWDGEEWIPADEKAEYTYNKDGFVTSYNFSLWIDNQWINYYRVIQNFTDDNRITLQANEFYNPDENEWVGCYNWRGAILYNTKTETFYNEQNRISLEKIYKIEDVSKGWEEKAQCIYQYTPLENGGYRQEGNLYLYEISTENVYDIVIRDYNKLEQLTYHTEKQDVEKNNQLLSMFEEFYEYSEEGDFLKGQFYEFEINAENLRLAYIAEEYIYDLHHNIIDSYYQLGALYNTGQGGAEEWINTTRFTYTYEADTVRTEKFAYMWDGTDYAPNWGEAVYFDFEVPVENVILWQDLKPYHKITETRQYFGDGAGWEYQAFTYYYSNTSGVKSNRIDSNVSVYPNPVANILHIETVGNTETSIYNLQGIKLLTTNDKQIDLSAMAAGIYIVEVNGTMTKIVKM